MPEITDWKEVPIDDWREVPVGKGLIADKPKPSPSPTVKEPTPREFMANIPPLTPQQELGSPTLTPEQEEGARRGALDFLWTNKEEAKRQFIKGITPALGIGTATAATLLAPSPWSTSLGFAAGERLGRGIETLTGVSKPETLPEATIKAAGDVALSRFLPWAAEKLPEIPGMVKRAVTQPWTQKGKVEEIFKTIGGKLEPRYAGESGLTGARKVYEKVSKVGNQLYEGWKKLFPAETKTPLSNLYSSVDDILTDPASSDAEKVFANKIYKRVSYETRRKIGLTQEQEIDLMGRAEETGQTGIMLRPSTIEEAYVTRSVLSEATKKGGKVGWRAGQMLDALHEDLNVTAEKLGKPEIVKEGQRAIDFWRNRVIPQRDTIAMIEKKSIETLPSLLVTDLKTVNKIMAATPKENLQDLKSGLITKIAQTVENNPLKVGQQLRKIMANKPEVMERVFTAEELNAIRLSSDPTKLGRYLEEHPKTKWLARFIGYGAMYGTIGYAGFKRLFHMVP